LPTTWQRILDGRETAKLRESPLAEAADRDLIYLAGLSREAAVKTDTRRGRLKKEPTMAWTTPILIEICIGLEINGYLPAEF
jgi:coenzyme PQQ precursor peptide PqqA